jgi:hypothetical protein
MRAQIPALGIGCAITRSSRSNVERASPWERGSLRGGASRSPSRRSGRAHWLVSIRYAKLPIALHCTTRKRHVPFFHSCQVHASATIATKSAVATKLA